ncbi:MAG: hypothetical protein ACLQLH_10535, partial [Terracidiphilus sp.]
MERKGVEPYALGYGAILCCSEDYRSRQERVAPASRPAVAWTSGSTPAPRLHENCPNPFIFHFTGVISVT